MKIYLAAAFARHFEMPSYAAELEALDHIVVSTWFRIVYSRTDAEIATTDVAEIKACDTLIAFTESDKRHYSGGRHVEFGMAVALGKRLLVVGPRENIFHHLPSVEVYDTWTAAKAALNCCPEFNYQKCKYCGTWLTSEGMQTHYCYYDDIPDPCESCEFRLGKQCRFLMAQGKRSGGANLSKLINCPDGRW